MYRRSDVIPQVESNSLVNDSGNSDVDVTVNVETTALAYALACFYYADGRLDKKQYETMLGEMDRQFEKRGLRTSRPAEDTTPHPRPFWLL
ncbi:hypothetical protein HUG15_12700 [Salicibibacter cibarius]|uniref:Uncharacterized protein n=1 Tax=Salicibibacter cibarius TaxID=2743000 RepID=A0A7T6Z3Q2_9BACI|nr:hypothetical protein [Salicibibacter cibarius]QQK76329.1 hypothetical protein HUG15_12700 [Salicibibacter cibarius]